jgi:hypothetical protein
LQKLRDIPKGTRRTRAGNRSDHFDHRKRKFGNLFSTFPALAAIRFLGADTVAGAILTSNEFLKNFEPVTKKPTDQENPDPESRT